MILDRILKNLENGGADKAYTVNNISYTYSELYKFVCNMYSYLLVNNKEKKPVIVYGHKQIYMKAIFLACSFAGITYVPIDSSMPKDRVNLIINQVKPFCIMGNFISEECTNLAEKEINEIINKENYKKISDIYLQPEDIYYIIFTSGSTGIPKGVKVTYSNLNSCINWLEKTTKISKEVVLNQAIFSFDLSVADLYLSLISGSEHFILEEDKMLDFKAMFKQLEISNATLAVMTPSYADLLLLDKNFGRSILPNLRTILFCGEKLLKSTVEKLYSRFGNIKIINSYGPTECTFAVTSIEITQEILNNEEIPIGTSKDGVEIFILNEKENELNEKEIGEIVITGDSVANGYLENINIGKFFEYKGKKAYKTGDLGYKFNNMLYYVSRNDNQIKFKGYRIELSDIEENIYKLEYIEKVKVIAKFSKDNKVSKIIAFVKLKYDKSILDIKNDLSKIIPDYMIPSIKILNEFPINNNGKTDIEKLRRIVYGE